MDENGVKNPKENKKPYSGLVDWLETFVVAVFILVMVFGVFFRVVTVDGSSMVDTLHDKNRLLLLNQFYEPEQGDIVVFYSEHYEKLLVKRVIAVGGQSVYIDPKEQEVYVDGVLLDEPYLGSPTTSGGNTQYPYAIPEGYLFVMGDNRQASDDSRMQHISVIPLEDVVGKSMVRVFPFSELGVTK